MKQILLMTAMGYPTVKHSHTNPEAVAAKKMKVHFG